MASRPSIRPKFSTYLYFSRSTFLAESSKEFFTADPSHLSIFTGLSSIFHCRTNGKIGHQNCGTLQSRMRYFLQNSCLLMARRLGTKSGSHMDGELHKPCLGYNLVSEERDAPFYFVHMKTQPSLLQHRERSKQAGLTLGSYPHLLPFPIILRSHSSQVYANHILLLYPGIFPSLRSSYTKYGEQ